MPRHPDTVVTPNIRLQQARRRLASPLRLGKCMSRSELATAINAHLHASRIPDADVDENYIGKLESGKHRWPRDDRRRWAFRTVLGVSTDAEIGFYAARRSRIDSVDGFETSAAVGTRVGDGEWPPSAEPEARPPELWLRMLDGLATAVIMHGQAGLYPVALEQIQYLDRFRQSQASPHPDLVRVDARWSEFMSWICDNEGIGGAQWLSRAYARAVEAGDRHLAAYVLMRQSQRALDDGDVRTAVALSRQALHSEALPPKTHALCLTRLAEGLALSGDDDSLNLVSTATRHVGSPSEHPADAIAQHCDHRYVRAAHARCRYLLGDHRTATQILEEVLSADVPASPLDTGMWLTYLADSYRPADPERSATTGITALSIAQRYGSARVLRALLPLAVTLRPHRGLDPVDEFLAAHRRSLVGSLAG